MWDGLQLAVAITALIAVSIAAIALYADLFGAALARLGRRPRDDA